MTNKKLIIFDLDGTLTKSKSPMEPEIGKLILKLLEKTKVAIISGGSFLQFQTQVLTALPKETDNYRNLYILPTSGTRLYAWKGAWIQEYAEDLTPAEKQRILNALDSALKIAGYEKPTKIFGQLIEDRGSQITFSALGQQAPSDLKYAWDPTRTKRERIAAALSQKIPEFEVRVGGATSVDVTKRGNNKAFGIRKLEQFLKIPSNDIIFIGDALFYGGNDYPAKATGIDCFPIKSPEETKNIILNLLSDGTIPEVT